MYAWFTHMPHFIQHLITFERVCGNNTVHPSKKCIKAIYRYIQLTYTNKTLTYVRYLMNCRVRSRLLFITVLNIIPVVNITLMREYMC